MKRSFGDRLEKLRNNLSQRDFAKKIEVPLTSYTNWVLGVSQPKFENICSICSILGVSADWLLGLSDKEPARPETAHDAASGASDAYWRDLVVSQQATIRDLAAALAAAQRPSTQPATHALSGGRTATKTA